MNKSFVGSIILLTIYILALVHDLAESIVGDITPYCGISREEKLLKEFSAISEIAELLGPNKEKLLELFNVSFDSIVFCRMVLGHDII